MFRSLQKVIIINYDAQSPKTGNQTVGSRCESPVNDNAFKNSLKFCGYYFRMTKSEEFSQIARKAGEILLGRGWRLATVESCTGGWICQVVTSLAGSSDWFECGLVTYSNTSKATLVGVPGSLISSYGAVSAQVAEAMVSERWREQTPVLRCRDRT